LHCRESKVEDERRRIYEDKRAEALAAAAEKPWRSQEVPTYEEYKRNGYHWSARDAPRKEKPKFALRAAAAASAGKQ